MAEFGESRVLQTTLASMFPISYNYLQLNGYLSPRTPQPSAPLAPDKVRPLITGPFSLQYNGLLKIADLNTELLFLARAVCAPTQSVTGGIGVIGGENLVINVSFVDVTVDDVTIPLVIQGLTLTGNLTFSGSLTTIGIIHIGFNSLSNLSFGQEITVASLELYSCNITKNLILPLGPSIVSLLIYGHYPQITFAELEDKKHYASLSALMYLNAVNGQGARDIRPGAKGFGAFSLNGLTELSYPSITTLAVPDPWSIDLETLFPNLVSLYVIAYPKPGYVSIPATPKSKYSMLTMIGAPEVVNLDISARAAALTTGVRIVGCPKMQSVLLRTSSTESKPLLEFRNIIIERCALVYLRGARGLVRPPLTLRLGDHNGPVISTSSRVLSRLLDYVTQGLPDLGVPETATTADYLPNVLVSLAESLPHLIQYPAMQTVEYFFTKPAADTSAVGRGTTYTQYSGGANPVIPSSGTGSVLTGAAITVSPFGIRYTLNVKAKTGVAALTTAPNLLPVASSLRGSTKGVLQGSRDTSANRKRIITALIVILAIGIAVIAIGVITALVLKYTRARPRTRKAS